MDCYKQIQTMLVGQLKVICRRVNQYLLLQNLHDTRTCDVLLEPEVNEDNVWRGETTSSESGGSLQSNNSMLNFTAGMFRCPVVWEVPFYLHPRLKTGPGRSGLSRGIKALHGVLNWLSVNNRSNMFVYQENNDNVFYLRLHEQTNDGKPLQNKLSESDEKLTVSRSNSAASLSQAKGNDAGNENSLTNDTRPRVRSFGEKESDVLNKAGDSIILKVHGISEAGPLVKCDLVQVLQNRLDDAVFEVLSVMLARNPMCKLTPADVHFIQKPYKNPESIVRLSVQPHCLLHVAALGHYLRQNLLQFLYIPKYTDHRTCYHFQDYSHPEGSPNRVAESDIFLYNQSPSSGSKGIACIALAIDDSKCIETHRNDDPMDSCEINLRERLKRGNFDNLVSASICTGKTNGEHLIEFRIWKQGRVNLEALLQKLSAAVRYATWDLLTEYDLLSTALTEPLECIDKLHRTRDDNDASRQNKHVQSKDPENIAINQYEFGEDGKLNEIYHTILTKWFKYALDVGVPAVKKHEVIIHHRHSIPVIVRELQNLIRGHAPDTSSRAFVLRDRQPFLCETINRTPNLIAFCENTDSRKGWIGDVNERESATNPVYVSCDFNKHEQGTYTNCILIARNFYQWKVSFGKTIEEELLVPKGKDKYNQ